ncbi:unnamed protein product, partial [Rotaria socialis]|jgi:hypothetical protein
MLLLLK